MTRAVIYVDGPVRPSKQDVGRQKKVRACHAYCMRMGYDVVAVITAAKPKPNVAEEALRIRDREGLEAVRAFYATQPHHPEDDADAMLRDGTADVKVEFTAIGDSELFDWGIPPALQERVPHLPRIERASLWEIEPPMAEERQWYYWLQEDVARRCRNESTRAIVYVRAMPTHIGYDGADQQERYCRGYCAQRRYEVAEVCLDSTSAGREAEWPGLQRAVHAVEDGRAHLMVALDAKHIAEDDEALVAIQTCIPHIEYAESYAYELLLRGFVEAMERLKPILEQIERRRAATGSAEDAGTTPDGART